MDNFGSHGGIYCLLFLEGNSVAKHWQTSVRVAGLVTLIAAVHYYYMRAVWIQTGENPNVYRYIDWLLTVPLQMVEFYLILAAVGAATAGMFWRLLIGTLVMLIAGFLGENGSINATVGFIVGMAGWIYILYEVFAQVKQLKRMHQAIQKLSNLHTMQ